LAALIVPSSFDTHVLFGVEHQEEVFLLVVRHVRLARSLALRPHVVYQWRWGQLKSELK
jgi:hypothetical protein